jgi:CheY-like chemotaxis protein
MARVLIVEDQWESSDLIADVIRLTFKDWTVEQVTSGHDACTLTATANFDVVIIDLALADGETGLDIVKHIAKAPYQPRVMLVTGQGDKSQGMQLGKKWLEQLSETEGKLVDGFFQKPYPWKEFLTTLARSTKTALPSDSRFFKDQAA